MFGTMLPSPAFTPRAGLTLPLARLVSAMKEFAALVQSRLASPDGVYLDPKTALLMLLTVPRATLEDGWQNQP